VEIGVGLFVAAGCAALFMLAMQVSNLTTLGGGGGYRITANFENIGGLKVRSPVTVSGVRVGRVEAINYDLRTFQAVVTMQIDDRYRGFPDDTSASIYTAGLLGEQYIALEPGGSPDNLKEGSHIQLTQSALVLERLIGKFLYSMAGSKSGSGSGNSDEKPTTGQPGPAPAPRTGP
jgi:phospholipid/cholesterol/gamma-HCH transport system substrate-binding protein